MATIRSTNRPPPSKPPYPEAQPGHRYNLAEVLAHIHGYQKAGEILYRFVCHPINGPALDQHLIDALVSEANRMDRMAHA